jgi:hypothetical protein
MIHLSGARCLAMSVVGGLFGWSIGSDSAATMAHYQALSHEALIAELAEKNFDSPSAGIAVGVFMVAATVIVVDVLTRFFDAVWKRIEPSSPSQPTSTPETTA